MTDEIVVQVVAVEPRPGSVHVLHCYTVPGAPVLVAVEPRLAAAIAERLAVDGDPCYAVVERWQVFGGDDPHYFG